MAQNSQIDSLRFDAPGLPYDKTSRELDGGKPHIESGQDMTATLGGKLVKRPGCVAVTGSAFTKRADRLWLYKTLEYPAKVYVLASAFDTGSAKWQMYYFRADAGSPAWTSMGSLRDLNASQYPHECVVSRGLAYIKGFPNSTEKLGTVVFDGRTATTTIWGILGPTTPVRLGGVHTTLTSAVNETATTWPVASTAGLPATPFYLDCGGETVNVTGVAGLNLTVVRGQLGTYKSAHSNGAEVLYRDWSPSSHAMNVSVYWEYVLGYVTKTGQVSCRSPRETNPDKRPSRTGSFTSRIPKLEYDGIADTTNVPYLQMYRSTDGGGSWYFLEKFNNPGTGAFNYLDDSLVGAGGSADPQPDELLDTARIVPALTQNLPPPTCISPKVLGTDTPEPSSPIEYFSGRLWYWIQNFLFYSGDTEIVEGIPEESWPYGNSFRARDLGTGVLATKEALYAFTDSSVYWVRGTDKPFAFDILVKGKGLPKEHPRAVCAVGNSIAWMTQDYQLAMVQENALSPGTVEPVVISIPLGRDIINLVKAGNKEVELRPFNKDEKNLLLVNVIDKATPGNTRQFVFDLNLSKMFGEPFWNTPWTIRNSACVSGRFHESDTQTYLLFYLWDGANGQLAVWDESGVVVQDAGANYAPSVTYNLVENPFGNHVNERSGPSLTTVGHYVILERTKFEGDTDPVLTYYADDMWTEGVVADNPIDPPLRPASKGYVTKLYHIDQAMQRVSVNISKPANAERFELQTVCPTFLPGSGA